MAQFLDNDGLKALWDKIKKTYALKSEIQPKGSYVSYTAKEATVAGTKKSVSSLTPSTLYVGNGLIMGGTAAAAGLVTRGICGVTTPDSTGACSKENLYINYDGDNNYSRKVVLGAGGVGESLGTGCGYTYCAIRGDEMKNYVKAAIESYPGVNKKGTVTSIKLNTTYTTALSASSAEEISTSGTFNLHKVSKTGSYNDLNNKPNAVTYSSSGSNYYLEAFGGGRYKISVPGTLKSDGTYKDVTIITSENLSSQGLFVPMVGTGSTPMSGDIQIKGEYEGTNASSGPISGGSGQTHTSPRNSDLSLGLKGISYHYYGNDNTYGGSSGVYTHGLCYKAMETSGGSYSKLDYLLDAGLNIFYYGGQGNTNPVLSNVRATTITYDGKLTVREGTTTTIKSIKNLMEKMALSPIDGSGWSTAGFVKDEMTGLMICYGATPQIVGAGNEISFSATFKGGPTIIVSPFFKSTTETSIVAQYRNSATIRCYVNSNGTKVTSTNSDSNITKFILDTGNGEKQYFHYIAIGQYK